MDLPDLGFIYRWEPSKGDSTKALLLLHGTGGTENDLIDLGKLVAPDTSLLSPRGQVIENGMPRFFKRKAVGVFDVEDLKYRAIQLADFIAKAKKSFSLKEIIALGYSNGANIASAVVLHNPELLAGAVLLRPMIPYQVEDIDLKGVKILMLSGALDNTVPEDEAEQLETLFKSNNADVTSHHLSASHGLTSEDIRISKEWFGRNFN